AWLERVGMALVEKKSLHPRAKRKAECVHHRRAGNPSAARCHGDHVARAIARGDMYGAAAPCTRLDAALAQRTHRDRIAGTLLHRGLISIDERAANVAVLLRHEGLDR